MPQPEHPHRKPTNLISSQSKNPSKPHKTKMSKQWMNRGLLSSTPPIVRWCQQRLNPCTRSPAPSRNNPGVETKSRYIVTRPRSPPPRYDQITRINPIPLDWQLSMGPKNSVLRGNPRPDENAFRRDPNVFRIYKIT